MGGGRGAFVLGSFFWFSTSDLRERKNRRGAPATLSNIFFVRLQLLISPFTGHLVGFLPFKEGRKRAIISIIWIACKKKIKKIKK